MPLKLMPCLPSTLPKDMPMPLNPDAEKLYRSAMRMRLTRAGLLKIMRENEERELTKISNADAVDNTDADAVD